LRRSLHKKKREDLHVKEWGQKITSVSRTTGVKIERTGFTFAYLGPHWRGAEEGK